MESTRWVEENRPRPGRSALCRSGFREIVPSPAIESVPPQAAWRTSTRARLAPQTRWNALAVSDAAWDRPENSIQGCEPGLPDAPDLQWRRNGSHASGADGGAFRG